MAMGSFSVLEKCLIVVFLALGYLGRFSDCRSFLGYA